MTKSQELLDMLGTQEGETAESLEMSHVDALADAIDSFMALAKKALPNIKMTSKAKAALTAIEKASDEFIHVASKEVEERKS